MSRTVVDALIELNNSGQKLGDSSFYIYQERKGCSRGFLSGTLYLWSGYAERAFVFATREQAQAVIDEFPDQLGGSFVGEWKR